MRENGQGIKDPLLSRLVMLSPNQTSRHLEMPLKAMVTEPLMQKGLAEGTCSSSPTVGRAG